MSEPAIINPRIIEALYSEALLLSDEVRHTFAMPNGYGPVDDDLARVALSSEGLRTTTRMMHAIAWLLNHRAYFMGEISELQLKRHGRLSPVMRRSDARHLAMLEPAVAELVETTRRFFDRLLRLENSWKLSVERPSSAVEQLCERIEQRLAS
jgi:regulator of CtrA degradation